MLGPRFGGGLGLLRRKLEKPREEEEEAVVEEDEEEKRRSAGGWAACSQREVVHTASGCALGLGPCLQLHYTCATYYAV